MTPAHATKTNAGQGIFKPGKRPIKVVVDEQGEYWLCDANVDPQSDDLRKAGCTPHSEVHMAEGG